MNAGKAGLPPLGKRLPHDLGPLVPRMPADRRAASSIGKRSDPSQTPGLCPSPFRGRPWTRRYKWLARPSNPGIEQPATSASSAFHQPARRPPTRPLRMAWGWGTIVAPLSHPGDRFRKAPAPPLVWTWPKSRSGLAPNRRSTGPPRGFPFRSVCPMSCPPCCSRTMVIHGRLGLAVFGHGRLFARRPAVVFPPRQAWFFCHRPTGTTESPASDYSGNARRRAKCG